MIRRVLVGALLCAAAVFPAQSADAIGGRYWRGYGCADQYRCGDVYSYSLSTPAYGPMK